MSKIKLYIATSIDGYIARKNNSLDWLYAIENPNNIDHDYGAFLSGSNIKRMKIDKDSFLIVGNESNGISDSVASFIDKKLRIIDD